MTKDLISHADPQTKELILVVEGQKYDELALALRRGLNTLDPPIEWLIDLYESMQELPTPTLFNAREGA